MTGGAYGQTRPSSTRPSSVATTAPVASPRTIRARRRPGRRRAPRRALPAASIRRRCASRMQWPPSVRKGCAVAPSARRSSPDAPAARTAAAVLFGSPPRPKGTTSIGSGKRPSVATRFDAVGDHDHAPARRRDDLLAQERAAAALDQAQLVVELVGAVDGEVELGRLVERRQRNAFPLGLSPRRLGGRNRDDVEAASHPLAEQRDEMRRRRAAAEPELHAVFDESHGALGGGALEGVGAHRSGRMAGGSSGFIPASYSRARGGGSYCGRVVPGPGAAGRPGPGSCQRRARRRGAGSPRTGRSGACTRPSPRARSRR